MTDQEREFYTQHIRERLSDYRFKHSVNVSREAVRLAVKYGGDVEKAELAGLLHDVMKDAGKKEQLELMEKYGVKLNEVEQNAPKLWHAIAGAVYVKRVLKIRDKDIVNAVRYHTTARTEMSLLEKIIYTADYTAKGRDYNGVEVMRELSRRSLEDAMIFSYQFTLNKLSSLKSAIHPDEIFGYNDIVLNRNGKE